MLREEVIQEWNKLKDKLIQQKEYLTLYQQNPFFLLTPTTPEEMIKQHQAISFLFLSSKLENQPTINLNELGFDTKHLQSIWLNYTWSINQTISQKILFTSDYSKNSWNLYPQTSSGLEPLWGRKIYLVERNMVSTSEAESGQKVKKVQAFLKEKRQEKDYQHTLYLEEDYFDSE